MATNSNNPNGNGLFSRTVQKVLIVALVVGVLGSGALGVASWRNGRPRADPAVAERLARLETQVEANASRLDRMDAKLDRLLERKP